MRLLTIFFVALSLFVAGCGADSGDSGDNPQPDVQGDTLGDADTNSPTDAPIDQAQACATDEECPALHYCNDAGACAQDCIAATAPCDPGFACSERGRCEGVDDCEGVVCQTPPASGCVGGVYSVYPDTGACERDRGCVYPAATTECGFGCAGDVCAECALASDCLGGTAPFCRDSDLVTPVASCDDGLCGSSESVEVCAFGCAGGACNANPCAGVSCTAQQAPECDGDSTILYEPVGTCVPEGENGYRCEYTVDTSAGEVCASGCTAGYCNDDPCAGVVCDTTPANTCDGNNLEQYTGLGVCNSASGSAVCEYTPTVTTCAVGCAGAACYECDGPEDCPSVSPFCDGDDRVFSSASCVSHTCGEQEVRETCLHGCRLGACEEPCAGVTCASPPAAYCSDDSTLVTASATGTCEVDASTHLPSCTYAQTNEPCGDSMVCAGDGCEVPPAPDVDWCRVQWPEDYEGDSAEVYTLYLRVFEAGITDVTAYANEADYGSMSGGVGFGPVGSDPATSAEWLWFAANPNPGFGGGTWANNDEFMGEITLPATSGNYDVAGRFTNDGSTYLYCDKGSSGSADGYSAADAASLLVYANDPCDGYVCDTPPVEVCLDGSTLQSSTLATGTCSSTTGVPVCDYGEVTVDCSLAGQVCQDDACVTPSADATIVFEADWDEIVVGSLHQGGTVNFDYDAARLPTCRATYNGYDAWSILIHYSFDGGAHWDYVMHDTGELIDVPGTVTQMQVYAQNNDRYGCNEYDSNMGANYWFDIAP